MTFEQLLNIIGDRRAFRTDELPPDPHLTRQLARWMDKGHLIRLQRGVYRLGFGELAHPLLLSNLLMPDSYITGRSALDFHGLLQRPHEGPVVAATKTRGKKIEIEGRGFHYRTIQNPVVPQLTPDCKFRVATPEGALFDMFYGRYSQSEFAQHDMFYERFDMEKLWQIARTTRARGNLRRLVGKLMLRVRQREEMLARRQARGGSLVGGAPIVW